MTFRSIRAFIVLLPLAIFLTGCNHLPGRPGPGKIVPLPSQIIAFPVLYRQNCAGCHGTEGRFGAALPLNNPVYLAMIDDSTLRRIISNGVEGTAMPPFAITSGGPLTTRQIAILIDGMRAKWQRGLEIAVGQPPYTGSAGNATRGEQVYGRACASCHGPGGKAGSILDPSFLALVSVQDIRSLVIAGRPDLGHPDWRGYVRSQPLSSGQVDDLMAWLRARKQAAAIMSPMTTSR